MIGAIGAVVGLIGAGADAYGQLESGKAEKKAQEYNAAVALQQAEASRRSGELGEVVARRQVRQAIGQQRASYAKAGVNFTGSAIDTMVDSLTNAEFGIAVERYGAEVKARGYESEAALRRFYGNEAIKSSRTGAISTLLGAGTSFGLKMGAR